MLVALKGHGRHRPGAAKGSNGSAAALGKFFCPSKNRGRNHGRIRDGAAVSSFEILRKKELRKSVSTSPKRLLELNIERWHADGHMVSYGVLECRHPAQECRRIAHGNHEQAVHLRAV